MLDNPRKWEHIPFRALEIIRIRPSLVNLRGRPRIPARAFVRRYVFFGLGDRNELAGRSRCHTYWLKTRTCLFAHIRESSRCLYALTPSVG